MNGWQHRRWIVLREWIGIVATAVLLLVGFWAFCALLFALAPR